MISYEEYKDVAFLSFAISADNNEIVLNEVVLVFTTESLLPFTFPTTMCQSVVRSIVVIVVVWRNVSFPRLGCIPLVVP